MSIGMQSISTDVFKRMLKNLSAILDRAQTWSESKKIDPSALLLARLAPDMFHLTRQVQAVTDQARNVARAVGQEPPKFENTEVSFADLKTRIEKTIEFLDSLPADKLQGAADQGVGIPMGGQTLQMKAHEYVTNWLTPNFYFHLTAAYTILRHNGLDIGKRDFLGLR